jgi:hypothetical protein
VDDAAVRAWVAGYGAAWVRRDPDLAVALFTDDAVYHQTPFGPHFRGTGEIARYWVDITEHEDDVVFEAGDPLVVGRFAACEWWVTMTEYGKATTLPGCLILAFAADGRCSDLREYWHQADGTAGPFPGWGRIGT